ncbi:MAG: MoaD/ThiS family protein [Deltaproteobacteria bacterium]|nr:MAG: MoaD/ThiS family protein [Deltaproteobacteria bacterium]
MITITAIYVHLLREVVGKFRTRLKLTDGTTVGQLLDQHIAKYGYEFKRWAVVNYPDREKPVINVQVNGKGVNYPPICPEGLNTALQEGDEVVFGLMPFGGG